MSARLFCCFCLSLLAQIIFAEEGGFAQQRELKTDAKEKVDTILVLDSSGSMRLTDPSRLRDEGAKLFLQFLKSGDQVGLIAFDAQAKILRPLSQYREDLGPQLAKEIQGAGDSGVYTDLLSGMRAAWEMLGAAPPREDANRAIILLSDGKMDPDPTRGSAPALTAELLEVLLPQLKSAGVKVHTLSFSDQADRQLLEKIATVTDGHHWFTPNADTIHRSYAELFLAVKTPQILPLTSKGFRIDQDIQEATFYINREQGENISLITPSGSRITADSQLPAIKWFSGTKFATITIQNPEVGTWQVEGLPANDGFATVLTDLKLTTDWPSSIFAGDPTPLQARLYEAKKPVALVEMTDLVRYAYQVTPTHKISEPIIRESMLDNGKEGDKFGRDGIYSAKIRIEEPGEYKVRIVASGPTFERHQQLSFRVKPRLIDLSVTSLKASTHAEGEKAETEQFLIVLSDELLGLNKVTVKLVAIDKARKRYSLPIPASRESLRFLVPVSALPTDGEYELEASFVGESRREGKVSGVSPRIKYSYKSEGPTQSNTEVVVLDDQPEPESPSFPWFLTVLMTIANGAAGGFAAYWLRKSYQASQEEKIEIPSLDPLLEIASGIDERSKVTEWDLDSPLFTSEEILVVPDGFGPATIGNGAAQGAGVAGTAETPSEPAEGQSADGG